jgi:glycosyltransferase involved in cell wall biosynthesis
MIDQAGMTTGRRRKPRERTLRGRSRTPVAFVAWGAVAGRSTEIAELFGGRAYVLFPPDEGRRPPPAVRYAVGSLLTLVYLAREDPGAVVTTIPPVPLGLIALAWARLRGVPCALDSHPGAFGKQGDRVSARLLPVHRYLVRHADVTLVTAESWVETVREWGGRGLVVHEAPGSWESLERAPREAGGRPRVLLVSRFAGDEPVEEAVKAAALVPEIDFLVTGRTEDLPSELARCAPSNVSFVGFLPAARYKRLVAEADVVVALTTEPTSVMRCAYEAVYARKPLLISDWPLCRELFPFALAVSNDSASIAEGLRRAVSSLPALENHVDEALALQVGRWRSQFAALASALGQSQPSKAHRPDTA